MGPRVDRAAPAGALGDELLRRRHLRVGWWSLAVFASLGLVLESFHAFKVAAYVDAANETRRLLFTLGHAHGVLLSLVHLVWAFAGVPLVYARGALAPWVSRLLIGASVLLPGGFLLGGIRVYGGDPGIGILLVPAGALCLITAIVLTASSARAPANEIATGPPASSGGTP